MSDRSYEKQETAVCTSVPTAENTSAPAEGGRPQYGVYYDPYTGQPYQSYIPPTPPKKPVRPPMHGMALASMILGLISLGYGMMLGIVAIVFGAVAKKKGNKSRMATAGIVCGIIGSVIGILTMVLLFWVISMMQHM